MAIAHLMVRSGDRLIVASPFAYGDKLYQSGDLVIALNYETESEWARATDGLLLNIRIKSKLSFEKDYIKVKSIMPIKKQMLNRMLALIAKHHEGQFDKSGMPYILHCLAVMNIGIMIYGSNDEELLCIFLGHDLFEDTKCTIDELRAEGFSERVINGILGLTKMPGQTLEAYKEIVFGNFDCIRAKKCDITHNMDLTRQKGIGENDLIRIQKYSIFYHELRQKELEFKSCP